MTVSNFWDRERLLRSTILAGFAAAGLAGATAYAQAVEEDEEAVEEEEEEDTVIVTGSRIQRSEFNSLSPVQVISGEVSREVGLVNAADILQAQSQATGTQIDTTFVGFVLDNGPGSVQLNLRGLNAERTLTLINGRRLAPAGIGGAPTSPDLTLIPGLIIERIDLLLDGASSIYGSDAVAGVANVVLRQDFEGVEFEYNRTTPFDSGGEQTQFAAAWGINSDRGFAGFAFEYSQTEVQRLGDRDFTRGCPRNYEIGNDGVIRQDDVSTFDFRTAAPGDINAGRNVGLFTGTNSNCNTSLINRLFIPVGFGSTYYTPGFSNIGVPDFSESNLGGRFGGPLGSNVWSLARLQGQPGPYTSDFDFASPLYNQNTASNYNDQDFIPEQQRWSFYSYGEHDVSWGSNTSAYYELLVANRQTTINSLDPGFFPTVPGNNPFNPCNQTSNPNGVNCLGTVFGVNFGNLDVVPIVQILGERDRQEADITQISSVVGFRGDLPFFNSWSYDLFTSYARSEGFSRFVGVDNDRLQLSLNTSVRLPNGQVVCGIDINGDGIPDNEVGAFGGEFLSNTPCVPVNLFQPSLYQEGGGVLSQAEMDYLLAPATIRTVYEQLLVGGTTTGNLFTLNNGSDVPLVLGFEYRRDTIQSQADDTFGRGDIIFRSADQGATGNRYLWEVFAETEFQPILGRRFAEEVTINLSGRWTDESNYGSDVTYSIKGNWRPTNWLNFRGSYGTSYRAPNAREQFLAGQTGFATVADPCVVPTAARVDHDNNPATQLQYDPNLDTRSQITIANCQAAGVDPTSLGLAGNLLPNTSVETASGGTTALDPETSRSQTWGVVAEQPWFEAFDLRFAVTYYDIVVSDSVNEPTAGFIVNDCYNTIPGFQSAFCNRIRRDGQGFLNFIDASFINIGTINSKGVDFNILYEDELPWFGGWGLTTDLRATRLNEQVFNVQGTPDDNAGETEAPHWTGSVRVALDRNNWRFTWLAQYIGGGEENNPGATGSTCRQVNPTGTGLINCGTPVYWTEDYITNTLGVSWTPDTWVVNFGIQNVFDVAPPTVDPAGVFAIGNVPIGIGHDLRGRRWFLGVRKSF
ncbi:TonB-dependent receptor domain-containing protein [Hyphobacterium indicum]|uniref:TonB-dependent receptor domain-containing protein n=1 Tax=Hyphobacterium indicum TaxID=2162714 RepID=UPI000D641F2B|nr:TonB-dependent receptor [Hyphobacterium indicum]